MQYILLLHILGAVITGITLLLAWTNIVRGRSLSRLPLILNLLTIFEIITGAGLTIFKQGSILHFCANIGIYLTLTTVTIISLQYTFNRKFIFKTALYNFSLAILAVGVVLLGK